MRLLTVDRLGLAFESLWKSFFIVIGLHKVGVDRKGRGSFAVEEFFHSTPEGHRLPGC